MEVFTKKDVKKVLNNSSKLLVKLALDLVNLQEKERKVIELIDLKGFTMTETANLLNVSVKTVSRRHTKAIEKCFNCWKNEQIIKKIIELK